jgi:hypothetical protein
MLYHEILSHPALLAEFTLDTTRVSHVDLQRLVGTMRFHNAANMLQDGLTFGITPRPRCPFPLT